MVDSNAVAHGTKNVHSHAARILADHLDIVWQIPSIWPLPNPTHTDNPAWVEQIASLHDPGDAMDKQVGADPARVSRIASPFEVMVRIPIDLGCGSEPSVPIQVGWLVFMLRDQVRFTPRPSTFAVASDVFDLSLKHLADHPLLDRLARRDVAVIGHRLHADLNRSLGLFLLLNNGLRFWDRMG